MPSDNFSITTSSPTDALLEVLLVTVPVRSAAVAVPSHSPPAMNKRTEYAATFATLLIIQSSDNSITDEAKAATPPVESPPELRFQRGSRPPRFPGSCGATRNQQQDICRP